MDDKIEQQSIGEWSKKDKVSQILSSGVYGRPEIKADEKRMFLGEFKERVLLALTTSQVGNDEYDTNVKQALNDPRAKKLIMDSERIGYYDLMYRKMAGEANIPYTIVQNKSFEGDIALVVVSDEAVDEENRFIQ